MKMPMINRDEHANLADFSDIYGNTVGSKSAMWQLTYLLYSSKDSKTLLPTLTKPIYK